MIAHVIERLSANAGVFQHLVRGVSPDQARWKPAPDKWSILEVVNHLADEEREDFRMRLDLTVHRPDESWPPIDPQGWVTARNYNTRDLALSLADFTSERERSVAWLRGLPAIPLATAHAHPRHGSISAGDLLASWLAHDLIHIRQIDRLHFEYLRSIAEPHRLEYAGRW